jgi:hypothetical protein
MSEIQKLLQRQAAWQRTRARLSWAEKVHMAEAVRRSVLQLRQAGPHPPPGESTAKPA